MRRLLCRAAGKGQAPLAAPPFAHPSALRPTAPPAIGVSRPWAHATVTPTLKHRLARLRDIALKAALAAALLAVAAVAAQATG